MSKNTGTLFFNPHRQCKIGNESNAINTLIRISIHAFLRIRERTTTFYPNNHFTITLEIAI
jgi:hypothetical protein